VTPARPGRHLWSSEDNAWGTFGTPHPGRKPGCARSDTTGTPNVRPVERRRHRVGRPAFSL